MVSAATSVLGCRTTFLLSMQREYLNIGVCAIMIRAEASQTPPLSHLADGQEMKCEANEMGRTGMFFSIFAIAAGAVMYWAVTSQGHGFRASTVGVILMIAGVIGLVASSIVYGTSRNTTGRRQTYDREATNAQGQTTAVHEEVR
jgi:hypothetical protein